MESSAAGRFNRRGAVRHSTLDPHQIGLDAAASQLDLRVLGRLAAVERPQPHPVHGATRLLAFGHAGGQPQQRQLGALGLGVLGAGIGTGLNEEDGLGRAAGLAGGGGYGGRRGQDGGRVAGLGFISSVVALADTASLRSIDGDIGAATWAPIDVDGVRLITK